MLVWTDAGILLQSTMNGCNERYYEVRDLSIKNGLADDQICHTQQLHVKRPERGRAGENEDDRKNEVAETTGESGITSALSYYSPKLLRL